MRPPTSAARSACATSNSLASRDSISVRSGARPPTASENGRPIRGLVRSDFYDWPKAVSEILAGDQKISVGVMLIGLGAHVLWRLWRDRVHFHRHGHGDGTVHFHAHSHAGETAPHARAAHAHDHGFRWRTLLVGLMHGMAGSAALLVLAVTQASSPAIGLGYVALFGVGSMIGMGALSTVIAVPLAVSARSLTWANRGLQGAVGLATVAIGIMTVVETVLA